MTWKEIIRNEQEKAYYKELKAYIDREYETKTIYPSKNRIFHAFSITPYDTLKVVILGQDPYHGPNQAQGLAFSTPKEIPNPPSMQNILKEIDSDTGKPSRCLDGDLTPWSQQGVLLLNTILTVEAHKAKSHHKRGWEQFTDAMIQYISRYHHSIVFLLWGSSAISKRSLIDQDKHVILTSTHPSPLSAYRGFLGCRHFSQTNRILRMSNRTPIEW